MDAKQVVKSLFAYSLHFFIIYKSVQACLSHEGAPRNDFPPYMFLQCAHYEQIRGAIRLITAMFDR